MYIGVQIYEKRGKKQRERKRKVEERRSDIMYILVKSNSYKFYSPRK